MSDLETLLAEARNSVIDDFVENGIDTDTVKDAFDAAAQVAREVVGNMQYKVENMQYKMDTMQEHIDDLEGARDERAAIHASAIAEKDAEIARLKTSLRFLNAECLCGAVTALNEKT